METPLFSFRAIPIVVALVEAHGIDPKGLFEAAGLPVMEKSELIAPLTRVQKLLDLAADATQRPLLGVDVAELVPSGTLGFTEFAMRSAPTVMRALEVLCELARLINPILDFRLVPGDVVRLHFAVPGARDALGAHLNEYTFALLYRQFSAVLGEDWRARELWFAHDRAAHRDAIEKRFGGAVSFGAESCGIAIDRTAALRAPPTADPVLFEFILSQARAQLASLEPSDVAMVARTIESRLPNDVSVEAIAAAMATTVRSLQRHLAAAGTSYRDVLCHVRRRRWGELSRLGIADAEIARRLGFVDAKSMRRSLVTE